MDKERNFLTGLKIIGYQEQVHNDLRPWPEALKAYFEERREVEKNEPDKQVLTSKAINSHVI